MNTDKINGVMLRAINLFKDGELETLQVDGETLELEGLEIPIAQMAKEISESDQVDKPFEEVLDVVTDVLGEAAARHFGAEATEEKLCEWMISGGANTLAQRVVEQLQG